jgi:hypothetical protein
VAVTDEGTGGGAAESVGGAGDEDAGHEMILPPVVVCWHRSSAGQPGRSAHGSDNRAASGYPPAQNRGTQP